ncbi:MAG: NADH:flavin oxidoreductase, partial [Pseudomonadota bacterium]
VLAELLVKAGCVVRLVTPAARVSDWTVNTLEQATIHRRLAELGVEIVLNRGVVEVGADHVVTNCVFTDQRWREETEALVMVASRTPNDGVYRQLLDRADAWADAGVRSVKLIGDAQAPAPIAWATYAGHNYARLVDEAPLGDALPFRREVTALACP